MGKTEISKEVSQKDVACLEKVVVAYNTAFLLSSIFVVIAAAAVNEFFSDFLRLLSPSVLLLLVAAFIVFTAGIGFAGVAKESSSLMSLYTMLLVFTFVLQIIAGTGILSFRGQIKHVMSAKMKRGMIEYPNDPLTANLVDYVQLQMRCCGTNNYRDWDGILDDKLMSECKTTHISLPASCCSKQTVENSTLQTVNSRGCLPTLNFLFYKKALLLSTSVIAICTIQILGAYFSYLLATTLRKVKTINYSISHSHTSQRDDPDFLSYQKEKANYF